jgi:hypothetical protein
MSWETLEADVESRIARHRCTVCKFLQGLDESDAVKVREVLAKDGFSTRAIFDAFQARGLNIGRESIGAHRRGACR